MKYITLTNNTILIRKLYFRITFLFTTLLIPFMVSGQNTIDSIKIGGIKLKPDQQEVLEKANWGVYYSFQSKSHRVRKAGYRD